MSRSQKLFVCSISQAALPGGILLPASHHPVAYITRLGTPLHKNPPPFIRLKMTHHIHHITTELSTPLYAQDADLTLCTDELKLVASTDMLILAVQKGPTEIPCLLKNILLSIIGCLK